MEKNVPSLISFILPFIIFQNLALITPQYFRLPPPVLPYATSLHIFASPTTSSFYLPKLPSLTSSTFQSVTSTIPPPVVSRALPILTTPIFHFPSSPAPCHLATLLSIWSPYNSHFHLPTPLSLWSSILQSISSHSHLSDLPFSLCHLHYTLISRFPPLPSPTSHAFTFHILVRTIISYLSHLLIPQISVSHTKARSSPNVTAELNSCFRV